MGNLTGMYTWLLFALHEPGSSRLGNAVALEAVITQSNKQGEAQTRTEEEPEEEIEQSLNVD